MPLAWSSTGSFSSSQSTDAASSSIGYNRTLTLLTVPSGTYGAIPQLVILQSGKSPNVGGQFFSASYGTPGVSGAGTNNTSRFGITGSPFFTDGLGDVRPAFQPTLILQGTGTQSINAASTWDPGFSLLVQSFANSVYQIRGTVSRTFTFPDVIGTNTFFTQELAVGSRITDPSGTGTSEVTVLTITDDTHMTVNNNANFTVSNVHGPSTNSLEDIRWMAALIYLPYTRLNQPVPTTQTSDGFEVTVAMSRSTAQLLNTVNGTDGLTGTSLDTSFGPVVTDHNSMTFDTMLGDGACVDAIAMVQGYTTSTPPFSIDLVNGNPNWQMIGTASTTGLNGQLSTFSAMAHWTRPAGDVVDTTLKWSGIPPTPPKSVLSHTDLGDVPGYCDIWMWPSFFPGGNAFSRAYVIV